MTNVEPMTKAGESEKLKEGMKRETTEDNTIESEVANPLTTLSAYLLVRGRVMGTGMWWGRHPHVGTRGKWLPASSCLAQPGARKVGAEQGVRERTHTPGWDGGTLHHESD